MKIKPGLFVTLAVCVSIIVFRYEIASPIWIAALTVKGVQNICPCDLYFGALKATTRFEADKQQIFTARRFISEDLSNGIEYYEIGGKRIWMPTGNVDFIAASLAEQKNSIYEISDVHINEGDIVLDCGSHVGVFTAEALRLGASKVIAVRPVPINLECVRRNLKSEIEQGRVIVYPKGVWDKDDVLQIDLDPLSTARDSFAIRREGLAREELPVTTIDKMMSELRLPRVDFIKMDIEGSEKQALRGSIRTIKKFHSRMAISL